MVFGLRFATVRPGYAQFFSELLFDRSLSLRALKRSSSLSCSTRCDSDPVCGGDKRDRTVDLLLAKQALSQLSYTPMFGGVQWDTFLSVCHREDSVVFRPARLTLRQ